MLIPSGHRDANTACVNSLEEISVIKLLVQVFFENETFLDLVTR